MAQGTGDRQTLSADGITSDSKFIGPVLVSITGSFGGGTATMQARDPNSDLVAVAAGVTADAGVVVDFPAGIINSIAIDLAGSTTPTVVIWIQGRKLGA